jgi:exodeoxyribonuclease-1
VTTQNAFQGPSLYWHDYETFGADPRRDRPSQFAGLRTDLDLNIVGDSLTLYCRPADDFLPHPEACLITGITPQTALQQGVPEAEFIGQINAQFSRPNTCVVGYNNLRFDDEVTRATLYRNFFDPYAREWQNGNSRWDIIDMVRLTHALRPQGINWPKHPNGNTSFKLDQLTLANDIAHESAHDALSDVHATIAVARLIKQRQPRLYDYVFNHRGKAQIATLLNVLKPTPVLHVSAMYAAERGCIALVAPIAQHPSNKNEILVYDLGVDPQPFLSLSSEILEERLFTPRDELAEGEERLPVKSVHINKSPVLVPVNTLTPEAAERWQLDLDRANLHLEQIQAHHAFQRNLRAVYAGREFEPVTDPDFMLYSGGFFSNDDRARMEIVRQTRGDELSQLDLPFRDERLGEMLFRYRARNYPQTLSAEERIRWERFRRERLTVSSQGTGLTVGECRQRIAELRQDMTLASDKKHILDALEEYICSIEPAN